jgi:hypothetical protein
LSVSDAAFRRWICGWPGGIWGAQVGQAGVQGGGAELRIEGRLNAVQIAALHLVEHAAQVCVLRGGDRLPQAAGQRRDET